MIPLKIPTNVSDLEDTFLDNIIKSLENEIFSYENSLSEWDMENYDDINFTNILRISYNFSDDAIRLLKLIFSICDLKPIISWMTLQSQYNLYLAFTKLDWQKEGKPEISLYIRLIKDARNSRFHNLFRISNTIEVDLDGISLQAKYLRFFTEYKTRNSKQKNFEFEENELIDLFMDFSRTTEKQVSKRFWEQNLFIMKSSITFFNDFCDSLKMLRTL